MADQAIDRAALARLYLVAKGVEEAAKAALTADIRAAYEVNHMTVGGKHADFTMATNLKQDRVVVDDEAEFVEYVRQAYPTEIEVVPATERVRPAFMSGLLETAAKEAAKPEPTPDEEPPAYRLDADIDEDPTVIRVVDADGRLVAGVKWIGGGEFSHVSVAASASMKRDIAAFRAAIAAGAVPQLQYAAPAAIEASTEEAA